MIRKAYIKHLVFLFIIGVFITTSSFRQEDEKTTLKCLIQTTNYTGEGAYIIVSLMNPEGEYDETLYILGDDSEWYHLIDEWWAFFGKEKRNIDGITGPTISGGERKIIKLSIPIAKLDKGYKIRFETSVEDQEYHPADLEVEANTNLPSKPMKGSGYIRYVRISLEE